MNLKNLENSPDLQTPPTPDFFKKSELNIDGECPPPNLNSSFSNVLRQPQQPCGTGPVRKANRLEPTGEEYNMAERQDRGRCTSEWDFSG